MCIQNPKLQSERVDLIAALLANSLAFPHSSVRAKGSPPNPTHTASLIVQTAMLSVERLVASVEKHPAAAAVLTAVVGALLGGYALLLSSAKKPSFTHPQPASTLPILGNMLDVTVFHNERLYDWLTEQSLALGGRSWRLSIPGSVPIVVISTPEVFEDVAKTQYDKFQKEEDGTHYFTDLFGKSILTSDGDEWNFHRKTANSLFSHQMIRDVMYAAVREKMQTFCEALTVYESRDQQPLGLKKILTQYTSDVFGKIGFGVDLHCLEHGVNGEKGNEFVDAFAKSTQIIFLRFTQPVWLWRLKRFLSIGVEGENKEHIKVVDRFIYRIIDESIERKNRYLAETAANAHTTNATTISNNPLPPPKDLVSLFLHSPVKDAEALKGRAFDSEMHLIRDTVVSFIFAGKDTTSHTMAFFVVMMNRHPKVLEKIREELRAKLSRSRTTGEILIPSMDDLPQLTYLEAAIRENLRLNPAIPISPRQAKEDLVLCDDTLVPKGTRVVMSFYAAMRSKEVWGDDALEFKPERWINPATGSLITVSPFKFPAFLAGPRVCLGKKLGKIELKMMLAVVLSRFNLTTVENPHEMTYQTGLTASVRGSLMINATRVGGDAGAVKRAASA